MSIVAQGTELYLIDPDDDSVITLGCITSFNPGGDPADQLEDTCLSDTARSYKKGLSTPGAATIGLNPDPADTSHIRLYEIYQDDAINNDLKFVVGWSDGTDVPTVDSVGDFELPTSRTWYKFDGYVSDFPFDFQLNTLVTSSVSVQRSGKPQWLVKV